MELSPVFHNSNMHCALRKPRSSLVAVLYLAIASFFLRAGYAHASPNARAVVYSPLELSPPRISSQTSAEHRGFPSHVSVHAMEREPPLYSFRSWRWHVGKVLGWDAGWRRMWLQQASLTVSERVYSVDMLGGISRVGEYYTRIQIGGQKVRVQVDTGSSTLALPVAECVHCLDSDLRYNMKLSKRGVGRIVSCANELCAADKCAANNCTHCSSTDACCANENMNACGFKLQYGDGSFARGALMIDDLTWGDNLTAPVVFGGILYDSLGFERQTVDGILGLAYASLACNPTCVEPPFQQMVKAGVVDDRFSICMTERGGQLMLGGLEEGLVNGPVTYVPLALSHIPTFYSVNVSNIMSIGDKQLALPSFQIAVVDSGTTLIVVSKIVFSLILRHMIEYHCDIPHMCDAEPWFIPTACASMSDDVLSVMPTLTFHLGPNREFAMELTPEDYMIRNYADGMELRCVGFMVVDRMSPGTDVILGNTVMTKYVTVYDREKKQMGFGLSKGTCGGPPDCSVYTQCAECSSLPEHCAYDFFRKQCIPVSSAAFNVVPFPTCVGSACACSLGPRAFMIYGFATGAFASAIILATFAVGAGLCIACRRRKNGALGYASAANGDGGGSISGADTSEPLVASADGDEDG